MLECGALNTVWATWFSLQFLEFLANSSILSIPSGENGSEQLRGRNKRNKMVTNLIPEDYLFILHSFKGLFFSTFCLRRGSASNTGSSIPEYSLNAGWWAHPLPKTPAVAHAEFRSWIQSSAKAELTPAHKGLQRCTKVQPRWISRDQGTKEWEQDLTQPRGCSERVLIYKL